jgi:hypothetical protein
VLETRKTKRRNLRGAEQPGKLGQLPTGVRAHPALGEHVYIVANILGTFRINLWTKSEKTCTLKSKAMLMLTQRKNSPPLKENREKQVPTASFYKEEHRQEAEAWVRSGCKHTYEGKNKGAENCDTLSKMDARK